MKVGLDVSLVAGERAGGGQYAYQLARALAPVDPAVSYLLYPVFYYIVYPDYPASDLPEADNMRVAFQSIRPRDVLAFFRPEASAMFKEWLLGPVDVVHSTTFCVPEFRLRPKALVVTIYDLSFITHPELHLPANVAHCLAGTRLAVERADAIIAISEHTRRDLVERLGAAPERIVVTPLAPDPDLAPVTDGARLAAVRHRYRLPERFVLFLGALEPRKNLPRLLEAYAALPGALRRDVNLVVAGMRGWLNDSIRARVAALGLAGTVHFAGYIDGRDLAAVYSLATVFAYPSLYEGFGLPVLEAMACGTPVLTSDASSLPEVAGDAALLVSPTDVEAIAGALRRLLEAPALREALAARGLRRAAAFSWDRCARQTLGVYRGVAGARPTA
jgi:glycosyltransferase involved in cell wall biosynthesis